MSDWVEEITKRRATVTYWRPWTVVKHTNYCGAHSATTFYIQIGHEELIKVGTAIGEEEFGDMRNLATFIANAPFDIIRLVREVKELRKQVKELKIKISPTLPF